MEKVPKEVAEAHKIAVDVAQRAYAPYSNFQVGAALKANGKIIAGCNVENASYGATICAERNAIVHSVAEFGKTEFEFMVVVSKGGVSPCGMCLQVLQEFVGREFPIYLGDFKGVKEKVTFGDLMPRVFQSSDLPK